MLDAAFERARVQLEAAKHSETLCETLEREYQLFTDFINQWTTLQAERYERNKERLGDAFVEAGNICNTSGTMRRCVPG